VLTVERLRLSRYWETRKDQLEDPRLRVVEAMRFKITLLCYLMIVPRTFGFRWWSPFLDIEVAMAMLNLPPERRRGRVWQKEFFQKHGLDFESMNLKVTHQNTLDLQALRRIPVRPLDVNLLREVVKPVYVEWINRNVVNHQSGTDRALGRLLRVRKVGGALQRLGFTDGTSRRGEAYIAYCVLLPIENLLRKRGRA